MNEAITAFATLAIAVLTLISVGVAYFAFRSQVRSFAASISADLSLKLLREFESDASVARRGRVADALLKGHPSSESEDVFDFFEQVGFFLRKGLIEGDVAHSFFFHWANLYWIAGNPLIEERRIGCEGLWREFEHLYRTTLQIEIATAPRSRFINPSPQLIRESLEEELP
jgi:cbb3-type cytochrome oxidase subunit 3